MRLIQGQATAPAARPANDPVLRGARRTPDRDETPDPAVMQAGVIPWVHASTPLAMRRQVAAVRLVTVWCTRVHATTVRR